MGEVPKFRGTFLGSPYNKQCSIWGLHWGPLIFLETTTCIKGVGTRHEAAAISTSPRLKASSHNIGLKSRREDTCQMTRSHLMQQ